MRYFVTIDGELHVIEVSDLPGGGYDVRCLPSAEADAASGERLEAQTSARHGGLTVRLGGRVVDLIIDGSPPDLQVFASGRRASVRVESERLRAAAAVRSAKGAGAEGLVSSPMPGKVVKLLVAEGDSVTEGAPLVVVEAMKMENELVAPRAGVVRHVFVKPGETVESGGRLVEVG
jgi:biotin carboxyl carrier protein